MPAIFFGLLVLFTVFGIICNTVHSSVRAYTVGQEVEAKLYALFFIALSVSLFSGALGYYMH